MAGKRIGEENVVIVEKREGLNCERKRKRGMKEVGKEEMKKMTVTVGSSSAEEPARRWPVRERKEVKRHSVLNLGKDNLASKATVINKGRGMQLKDIPNVAYKLSKRKADSNLEMLHTIIFGKKANKYRVKRNIRQFSGFVWDKKEGKESQRLKERINKCVKESLFDFCELLDISVSKASKKEELSEKLFEFLESPYVVSIAEKEESRKGKRCVRLAKGGKAASHLGEAAKSSDKILKRTRNDGSKDEEEEHDKLLPEEGGNLLSQPEKTKKKQNTQRKRISKQQVQASSPGTKRGHIVSEPATSKSKGKFIAARANAAPKRKEMLPILLLPPF